MNIKEALDRRLITDATPQGHHPTQLPVWNLVLKIEEKRQVIGSENFSTSEALGILKTLERYNLSARK